MTLMAYHFPSAHIKICLEKKTILTHKILFNQKFVKSRGRNLLAETMFIVTGKSQRQRFR